MEFMYKLPVLLVLGFIVFSLGQGMYYLAKDDGDVDKTRVVRALTVRIVLSLTLFGLLIVGYFAGVLEPHRAGRPVVEPRLGEAPLAPDELLVLEGPWLLHPRLRLALDRVLHVAIPEELALARAAARGEEGGGSEGLARRRDELLPAQRRFERALDPAQRADLVLDGSNPLGAGPPG